MLTSYRKQAALGSWDNILWSSLLFSGANGSFSTAACLLTLPWAFSYSLAKLENYSLFVSLSNSFEVTKSEKQQKQNRWIDHWKSIIDIFIYLTGWIRFTAPSPFSPKGNSKFEVLLVKIFNLKQKTKSNNSSYYRKNRFSRKQFMVPLDRELQWVNLKQKHLETLKHIQA